MENLTFGFIILRCVRNVTHKEMWIECYNCIRKFYTEQIIIIDDNSNQSLIDNISLVNTQVIQSEYPGSRELLPYYYFHKLKPFDKAVILHDSMFIQEKINFSYPTDVTFLWYFSTHQWDNVGLEKKYLKMLNNGNELDQFYDGKQWYGCFGVASVISYEFMDYLQNKYNIFKLLDCIKNRNDAMTLERIFGLLCFIENKISFNNCSVSGCIFNHPYCFSLSFESYKNNKFPGQKLAKCWTGR